MRYNVGDRKIFSASGGESDEGQRMEVGFGFCHWGGVEFFGGDVCFGSAFRASKVGGTDEGF
jgi:hypothetical protein